MLIDEIARFWALLDYQNWACSEISIVRNSWNNKNGTILLSTQERILHWDLWHLIDACCHGKNQRYQILSSLRDNIEHDNNNKCQKLPGKTFLQDFNRQFLKINFNEKKLYCIQPLRNTAKLDQFYAFY